MKKFHVTYIHNFMYWETMSNRRKEVLSTAAFNHAVEAWEYKKKLLDEILINPKYRWTTILVEYK